MSVKDMQSVNLLAIDTSSAYCSVALSCNGVICGEHLLSEQSHSEHVLPMVRRLLDANGMTLQNLDAFVVGIGPGGFTGVRMAVAVVQGLAYATKKPVIALSSLLALAQAANDVLQGSVVLVANDARMQQVYWAAYHFDGNGFYSIVQAPSLGNLKDVIAFAATQNLTDLKLAGNAWTIFDDFKAWSIEYDVIVVDIDHGAPNAINLLPVAQRCFFEKNYTAPHLVAPLYVRDKIAQTIVERAVAKAV